MTDYIEHISQVNSDNIKQIPSDILKLYDRVGKMEDVILDSKVEKDCQSIDVSQSGYGSNAFYLSSSSYPINNFKNDSACRDSSCLDANSEFSLISQEDLFYMDKVVTVIKQPQLSILTSSSTVKDMCIDESTQTFEKVLLVYDKVDEGSFACLNIPRVNGSSILMEEKAEKEKSENLKSLSTIEGIRSLGEIPQRDVGDTEFQCPSKCSTNLNETRDKTVKNDLRFFLVNEYPAEQHYTGSSISERRQLDITEKTACRAFEEIIEPRSHILTELKGDFSQIDSSSHIESTVENHNLRQKIDQVEEEEDLTNIVSNSKDLFVEDEMSAFFDTVTNKIDNTKAASDYVKLHDLASTTNLEAGDTSMVCNKNKVINSQLSVQSQNDIGTDEPISDVTTSARTSFSHLIHGGSNLLEPSNLSGSINTSTNIPYSGSISFQSESSATSAQSFAFPTLQPEWSISPVRMAKASRRHLRKHRWKTKLMCCKF